MIPAEEYSRPAEENARLRPRQRWLELVAQVLGALLAAALGLLLATLVSRFIPIALPFLVFAGIVLGFYFWRRPLRARLMRLETDENALVILLVLQLSAVLIVAFVPFGFDHPSSWGLDFGHLLVVACAYSIVWMLGLVTALGMRRWGLLLAELALPCAYAALAFSGVLRV